MMNRVITAIVLLAACIAAAAQQLIESRSVMPVGAYYYPEQWDESQWERDLKRMAALGFEFTHMAEFAWARMEPEDSVFDFGWLDRSIALAQRYGLKVILCTPSPTPPAWLTAKHPEVLVTTDEGRQVKHGMRLNCNGCHPVYQHYVRRIIELMARRYGNHPAVVGWQIDNEPHFEGLCDYSDFARQDFRRWLRRKYTTIERLNRAWGGAFWSFAYNDFSQIDPPNAHEHTGNPHAFVDFKRYTAEAISAALHFQGDVLRPLINRRQWITTNFAYPKFLPTVDMFGSRADLDFASYTMYPMNTFLNYAEGQQSYRLGSGMELAFATEMARSVRGRTGIMELQPGQINWGTWNSQPLPGAVRLWLWHCFALGDDFVCTYRYRQPLYGGEQFHKGIMEPDGITLSPGGREFVKTIGELKKLKAKDAGEQKKLGSKDMDMPPSVASRATAFLWRQDQLFSMQHTEVRAEWDAWQFYYTYYQKLKTMGAPVTFLQETDDFDPQRYPFMVAPAYEMLDSSLVSRWTSYVERGGHLLLTLRTGMKDNDGHLWEGPLQAPIAQLIGASVEGFDQLPRNNQAHVTVCTTDQTRVIVCQDDRAHATAKSKDYAWNLWGDQLVPFNGTEVWGRYADQFYAGTPCIVYRKKGLGAVCYVGVASTDGSMEEQVLREFYTQGGAELLQLPDYVFTEYRPGGFWVTLNYTSQTIDAPIPDSARILVGTRQVEPAGVVIWQ